MDQIIEKMASKVLELGINFVTETYHFLTTYRFPIWVTLFSFAFAVSAVENHVRSARFTKERDYDFKEEIEEYRQYVLGENDRRHVLNLFEKYPQDGLPKLLSFKEVEMVYFKLPDKMNDGDREVALKHNASIPNNKKYIIDEHGKVCLREPALSGLSRKERRDLRREAWKKAKEEKERNKKLNRLGANNGGKGAVKD